MPKTVRFEGGPLDGLELPEIPQEAPAFPAVATAMGDHGRCVGFYRLTGAPDASVGLYQFDPDMRTFTATEHSVVLQVTCP